MKKVKIPGSDFLFSNTGFLMGMGSVLNISGNYFEFNSSEDELSADEKALSSDWSMVGVDIKNAMKELDKGKRNQKILETSI